MALDQQVNKKSVEHTIAEELSRADIEAERRKQVKPSPPEVLLVFVVDGKVLPTIELPPFKPDLVYNETQIKTFKSGHIEEVRLSYTVHIVGAAINYNMEEKG